MLKPNGKEIRWEMENKRPFFYVSICWSGILWSQCRLAPVTHLAVVPAQHLGAINLEQYGFRNLLPFHWDQVSFIASNLKDKINPSHLHFSQRATIVSLLSGCLQRAQEIGEHETYCHLFNVRNFNKLNSNWNKIEFKLKWGGLSYLLVAS